MRKRLMNISKRCMVAIMSASFIMSSVTVSMAFPVGVYAEDNTHFCDKLDHNIENNTSEINNVIAGVQVENNNGSILLNEGIVVNNNENHFASELRNNVGTVVNNNAKIEMNNGTVTNNYGTIDNSSQAGVVVNQYEGSVAGLGSVTNYFGGDLGGNITVTNNYSDQVIDATNDYSAVNFIAPEGGTVAYSGSFTTAKPDGTTDVHYVDVTNNNGSGTITIKPQERGYEVTREAGDVENATMTGEGESYTFNYSLKKSGNNYVLNISNYLGKSSNLDADMFALAIQAIKLPLRPTGAVVQNEDRSVSVGYTDADTAATAPARINNSNNVDAFYKVNGIRDFNVGFRWQMQGEECMAAFNAALPAGYKIFDTLSMSDDHGRNTYDRKTGELSITIPADIKKTGRKFAIMCINNHGDVFVYYNTSERADLFTTDINFTGYAMCLIYKD